ncbi:MAG: hypothetical protein AAFX93_03505 [Verrucomicrobiota bacterium]
MFLIFIAPIIMLFDITQLLVTERYIGVKQIRKGLHPLDQDRKPANSLIFIWLMSLTVIWFYMIAMAFDPRGGLQGGIMLLVSIAGFGFRRISGIKWALVIMTIETAIRLGLLANLLMMQFLFKGNPFRMFHQ